MDNKIYQDANFMRLSFGDFGLDIINTGEGSSAYYGAVVALEETQFDFDNVIDGQSMTHSILLPAGLNIYGNITNITSVTGKLIAYKR